jgi:hypothetical protein
MNHDSMNMPWPENNNTGKDVKMIATKFAHVDPGVASYMKSMAMDYLAIKNALARGDETAAAGASGKMAAAMKGFDKSLLSVDQKKVYDDIEEGLREHAEHISEKNKIEHKRFHFSMMSGDMYELVKAFGAGMTLYHDHFPMYNENKGAMWLSESKEIRNPYLGDKMMTCGSVEEMFK